MDIKIRDTDCGGVVYYANYLDYFERARTEWMEERGVSVKALAEKGILFVVKTANIEYISPARYGEIITVDTRPVKVGGVTINFVYKISEKESGRDIASGSTKLVCINKNLKPVRLPAEIIEKLSE